MRTHKLGIFSRFDIIIRNALFELKLAFVINSETRNAKTLLEKISKKASSEPIAIPKMHFDCSLSVLLH